MTEPVAVRLPDAFFASRSGEDVFLSPHFDDICFSLAELVSRRRGGRMITLFSWSSYLENPETRFVIKGNAQSFSPAEVKFIINVVSRLRAVEDQKFCREMALAQHLGGIDEAMVRGRNPLKDTAISAAADTPLLSGRVMAALAPLRASRRDRKPWMFCPMGIGGHVDHLILRDTVLANLEDIRREFRLAFYEELPYASSPKVRAEGLGQFFAARPDLRLTRYALPLARPEEKLRLIGCYPSQMPSLPQDLRRFSPASEMPGGAHEAIWAFASDPPASWTAAG